MGQRSQTTPNIHAWDSRILGQNQQGQAWLLVCSFWSSEYGGAISQQGSLEKTGLSRAATLRSAGGAALPQRQGRQGCDIEEDTNWSNGYLDLLTIASL